LRPPLALTPRLNLTLPPPYISMRLVFSLAARGSRAVRSPFSGRGVATTLDHAAARAGWAATSQTAANCYHPLRACVPAGLRSLSTAGVSPISEGEVLELQSKWGAAIKSISQTYLDQGDYIAAAGEAAAELYGYGHSNVLFKPTLAADFPFRPTGGEAMSYFVGGAVVEGGYDEDAGFAINGGKGWKDVVFNNHQIDLNGPVAIAMGQYVFTCATTGDDVTVEYTFGYKRNDDGKARIFLHHSSVPYQA
jgi:hypothetical protein